MSFFDAMGRRFLWEAGWDYSHRTGHGIGSYLSLHELPPQITTDYMAPGMVKNMFVANGKFKSLYIYNICIASE